MASCKSHKPNDNSVLGRYPTPEKNVFLMMSFRDSVENLQIRKAIEKVLRQYDLQPLRADDGFHDSDLWDNVQSFMKASSKGIAVFEQLRSESFNSNVSIELGYMMAKGTTVLILKEKSLKALPSDIMGRLYRSFDGNDIESSIEASVKQWLVDLGIARRPEEKLVLFMSYGGTCRCAMAKIVLRKALEARKLPFRLRVESVAKTYGSSSRASEGARDAIKEYYGRDLLRDHVVTRLCSGLIGDASLILPMDRKLCEAVPRKARSKAILFSKFFMDEIRDIPNPWPTRHEPPEKRLVHYRESLEDIVRTMLPNVDRLIDVLNAQ